MRTIGLTIVLALLVSTVGVGCANYTEPIAPLRPLTPSERNFRIVWRASLDVLRSYGFRIDRMDPRDGVISTFAMTGKHFFEFWRKDTATVSSAAESAIQTIYRDVTVTLRPADADGRAYYAFVIVRAKRSDLGTPQVSSVSEAYSLFQLPGDRISKGRRWFLEDFGRDRKGPDVVKLGRDYALEAKIRADILAAAGSSARVAPRPSATPKPVPAP